MKAVNIIKKEDYAILELNNGKVNALNTQILEDIKTAFDQFDKDKTVKGVILAGKPHVFSAGLDVIHLVSIGDEGTTNFWVKYIEAMQSMLAFSKPLVCGITGYAPAGATILTLLTDYRIMGKGKKHVIGMHEFKMQMLIPQILCDVYAYHLGEVKAWKYVQQARLFNSDEALEVGLVDESVEVEEVLPRAEKHLKKLMNVHPKVYHQSKLWLRKKLIKIVMDRDIDTLSKEPIDFLNETPFLKQMVAAFAASLKK